MKKSKIEYLHYDENVDHLVIYKNREKILSTIDTGFVLISLNKKREIVGLEFMGAHKNFGISLSALNNLSSCKVEIEYNAKQKATMIRMSLRYASGKRLPLPIPLSRIDLGNTPFTESFSCTATA